jgi:CCR4-NOT complex subunit CAF16
LGVEWAHNPVVKRDVEVSRLLATLGAQRHPERCAKLLEILDVDPNWHMHQVSDGQRRRVQIILGLLEPWDVLLLDEVTVDLDVLARGNLLKFLKEETEQRGATIVYATHIFDGIMDWPSHIAHMVDGTLDFIRDVKLDFPELRLIESNPAKLTHSPLLMIAEEWLRRDYAYLKSKQPLATANKTRWDVLAENMKEYGDKYYNYWR